MFAAMAQPTTSSLAMKSPLPASFSAAPLATASAYSSKSSTPMSPASPMSSSHDSPNPSTAVSSTSSSSISAAVAKPQLAIKPVAPSPPARPLQIAADGAPPDSSVMSMTSVVSPMPQSPAAAQSPVSVTGKPPMSITSKEWVIPPRPKPGRKPATDTPPTKRKAQNRAAQRAFRERRAARVGELEELLEDQKTDQERTERETEDKIRTLETEVQVLRSRCRMLENLLEKEKAANQAWATKDRQNSASQSSVQNGSVHRSSSSIQPPQPHQQQHQHQQSLSHTYSPSPHKLPVPNQPRGSASSSISSVSGRRTSAQPFSISQIISPPDDEDLTCGNCNVNGSCACADEVLAATVPTDCGKCSVGTKCACLEASINALTGGGFSTATDLKRSHSASSPSPMAPEEKRARRYNDVDTSTEIDFTHMFSRLKQTPVRTPLPSMPPRHQQYQQHQQVPQSAPRFEIPLKERCGFCSDGTYCVCADSMPGVTMAGSMAISAGTVVAQQKTPPPSENDGAPTPLEVTATGAIKLSSMNALRRQRQQQQEQNKQATSFTPSSDAVSTAVSSSKCGPGGPGTCAQCLADPVSGLFCRSLAANFQRQGSGTPGGGANGGGCCGGSGAGGGCCKDKNNGSSIGPVSDTTTTTTDNDAPNAVSAIQPAADASEQNISLSCADAYKTLASHRHFDEATDEIGTWLPKLRAAPRHDSTRPATRHPMEVEAASIMSVLKGFDVRFGK